MKKKKILSIIGLIVIAITFVGDVISSSSNYGPMIPLTLFGIAAFVVLYIIGVIADGIWPPRRGANLVKELNKTPSAQRYIMAVIFFVVAMLANIFSFETLEGSSMYLAIAVAIIASGVGYSLGALHDKKNI